jgi:hypothetical protein
MTNDLHATRAAAEESSRAPGRQSWRDVVDNPWLLIIMLFFVTAALGLPLLWVSRGFSTFWKVTLTFAVLAWTALVFWVFFLIMAWCLPVIWDSLRQVFS